MPFEPPLSIKPNSLACPACKAQAKRYSDDGAIWPLRRQDMTAPRAIVERMVEDMDKISNRGETCVLRTDLHNAGWPYALIFRHEQEAINTFAMAVSSLTSKTEEVAA